MEISYFDTCYCQISETEMLTFSLFCYFETVVGFLKKILLIKDFIFIMLYFLHSKLMFINSLLPTGKGNTLSVGWYVCPETCPDSNFMMDCRVLK